MALLRSIAARFSRSANRSSPSPEPAEHIALGEAGEVFALGHLRAHGYKILYRNFRAPHGGEVDIVCRDGDTLVFVEVKTRRSDKYGRPGEAVTPAKQRLIAKGALTWLRLLHYPKISARFDVVEVLMRETGPEGNIVRDAFPLPKDLG